MPMSMSPLWMELSTEDFRTYPSVIIYLWEWHVFQAVWFSFVPPTALSALKNINRRINCNSKTCKRFSAFWASVDNHLSTSLSTGLLSQLCTKTRESVYRIISLCIHQYQSSIPSSLIPRMRSALICGFGVVSSPFPKMASFVKYELQFMHFISYGL